MREGKHQFDLKQSRRKGHQDLITQRNTLRPNHILCFGFSRSYFGLTKKTVLLTVSNIESEINTVQVF